MAVVKVNTNNKMVVAFQSKELAKYGRLTAFVERHGGVFVNFSLPYIVWKGHDVQVIEDIISAIKLLGNFCAKVTTGKPVGWQAFSHPPTILNESKIRLPVFANHSHPYVQAERTEDGYVHYTVEGYSFFNDVPSAKSYVGALTKLKELVKQTRL